MSDIPLKKHDLAYYVEDINTTILKDYEQIQTRVREDPGTAGDQVEETWAEALRKWLPKHFHVVTKGRIVSAGGEASPQIDVIVLWPSYPPFLLTKKLYLASGVAAAFECKLTLRKAHLKKIFSTAVKLSEMTEKEHGDRKRPKERSNQNYAYEEYHRIFEYGILAHSFEGNDTEKVAQSISDEIYKLDQELVKHPTQMVDLICVQGLGSWASERYSIHSTVNVDIEKIHTLWNTINTHLLAINV